MPSRPVRVIAFVVVAAGLLAGALDFSRALEPGRSERDGYTLPAAIGTSDWFPGSPRAQTLAVQGGGLELRAATAALLLVTRGLPVDPDACYVGYVRARAQAGEVMIAVFDESIQRRLAAEVVPLTARPTLHELRFEPSGRARVTFGVVNTGTRGRVLLESLRLARRQC